MMGLDEEEVALYSDENAKNLSPAQPDGFRYPNRLRRPMMVVKAAWGVAFLTALYCLIRAIR